MTTGDVLMDRRTFVATVGMALLARSLSLRAQGPVAVRRIGVLSAFARAEVEAFLGILGPELEKLGWTQGQNIVFLEPRTTDGANDRLPSAAGELVSLAPDLILVQSVPATRALMQATKSIPIVMFGVGNPVEYGIVANHSKPGGNVTGSSYLASEYTGKLLQLLKEAVPRLQRVAFISNPSNETAAAFIKQLRANAVASGIQLEVIDVSRQGDLEAAFMSIRSTKSEAILLPPEALIQSNRNAIAGFAQTHRLPLAVVGNSRALPAGGLIAYGPTRDEYARLTAGYVERILKGAQPSELPVEQPTRFSLVLNLKTANALGLTIPQSLLQRADEVIQ